MEYESSHGRASSSSQPSPAVNSEPNGMADIFFCFHLVMVICFRLLNLKAQIQPSTSLNKTYMIIELKTIVITLYIRTQRVTEMLCEVTVRVQSPSFYYQSELLSLISNQYV